jgi:hypothetical protein
MGGVRYPREKSTSRSICGTIRSFRALSGLVRRIA